VNRNSEFKILKLVFFSESILQFALKQCDTRRGVAYYKWEGKLRLNIYCICVYLPKELLSLMKQNSKTIRLRASW